MGRKTVEAAPGFEPGNRGFADPCLASWLRRLARASARYGHQRSREKMVRYALPGCQSPPMEATTGSCSILKASPAVSPKPFTDAQSAGSPDCHLPGDPDHDRDQAADGAAGSTPSTPAHARVRAAAVADACGRASTHYPAPGDRDRE